MDAVSYSKLILRHCDTRLKLCDQENVVLILGMTGSGKSTFTQYFVAENENLKSIDHGNCFLIVDNEARISSGVLSCTIYPELVIDRKREIAYYDCGGFCDTRSAEIEIASAYMTKKIIDHAARIKLALVVSYHSVKKGAYRDDFMQLLNHVATLVKRPDKFKSSIVLVVTKVMSLKKVGSSYVQMQETEIVPIIANFIEDVRASIQRLLEVGRSSTLLYGNMLNIIDALLSRTDEQYTQICIFREPDESGPIHDIAILQEGKISIEEVIVKNTTFSPKAETDFGYTLSDRSKNQIHDIMVEIDNALSNIGNHREHVRTVYSEREEKYKIDLTELTQILLSGYRELSALSKEITDSETPHQFYNRLCAISDANTKLSEESKLQIEKAAKHFQFLQCVSDTKLRVTPMNWKNSLNEICTDILQLKQLYEFLLRLYGALSLYKSQRNRTNLNLNERLLQNQTLSVASRLNAPFNNIISTITDYDAVKNIKINNNQTAAISNILELTLRRPANIQIIRNTLQITGVNVSLSEFNDIQADYVSTIKIFSLNNVFIDTDICKIGKMANIVIIAPCIEIIGKRHFNLDGSPGKPHSIRSAENGQSGEQMVMDEISNESRPIKNGHDGKQGLSGSPGGSFFGCARHWINSGSLTVTANGGNGGPGQRGGNGATGLNGKDATGTSDSSELLHKGRCLHTETEEWPLWLRILAFGSNNKIQSERYSINGEPGALGGIGGKGGAGGIGGSAGQINIIALKKCNPGPINITNEPGKAGIDGEAGTNGKDGLQGKCLDQALVTAEPQIIVFPLAKRIMRCTIVRDAKELYEFFKKIVVETPTNANDIVPQDHQQEEDIVQIYSIVPWADQFHENDLDDANEIFESTIVWGTDDTVCASDNINEYEQFMGATIQQIINPQSMRTFIREVKARYQFLI